MWRRVLPLHRDQRGPAAAEWMLVTAAVVALCAAAWPFISQIVWRLFLRAASIISSPLG